MNSRFDHNIFVCMGRACFKAGNAENLRIINEFLTRHEVSASVRPMGHLCDGMCGKAPTLVFDGSVYHNVDAPKMRSLLDSHLNTRTISR
ncbi:MAG: (2Fe-2S) ferredoxin domain-containing protein [Bryobacteraceae bacterium]